MDELAKLLGTTKEKLESLSDEMGKFTGKKEVPDQLLAKIKDEWARSLTELGLKGSSSRKEVLAALAKRVELLEEEAKKVLGEPAMQDHDYIKKLFARAESAPERPRPVEILQCRRAPGKGGSL